MEDNGTVTKTEYCGPFVYETVSGTRSLKYIVTPEGRAVKSGSSWDYEYNLKDHLGNVRAVIRSNRGVAQLIQEQHYYPFGMEMSTLSSGTSTNKYLYNGKELENAFDLGWYDYGARFYDAELGRWHSVDPAADEYQSRSQYNYTLNNPIRFIDPDGRKVKIKMLTIEAHASAQVILGKGAQIGLTYGNGSAIDDYGKILFTGVFSFSGGDIGDSNWADAGISFNQYVDKKSKSFAQSMFEASPPKSTAIGPVEYITIGGEFSGLGIGLSLGAGATQQETVEIGKFLGYTQEEIDQITSSEIRTWDVNDDGNLVITTTDGRGYPTTHNTDIKLEQDKHGGYYTPGYLENKNKNE